MSGRKFSIQDLFYARGIYLNQTKPKYKTKQFAKTYIATNSDSAPT